MDIMAALLANYNDGRRKTFFCTAVNLLSTEESRAILPRISPELPLKERSATAVALFESAAARLSISLKLLRKPK